MGKGGGGCKGARWDLRLFVGVGAMGSRFPVTLPRFIRYAMVPTFAIPSSLVLSCQLPPTHPLTHPPKQPPAHHAPMSPPQLQHSRAVECFRRALRLNPRYLSAWTLMGHEYVELKNAPAAIGEGRGVCGREGEGDYVCGRMRGCSLR